MIIYTSVCVWIILDLKPNIKTSLNLFYGSFKVLNIIIAIMLIFIFCKDIFKKSFAAIIIYIILQTKL